MKEKFSPPKTNLQQAIAAIDRGDFSPVYYLYGEEPFKVEEFVARVQKQAQGRGFEKLDGSEVTGTEILENLQSYGLFNPEKILLVRQAHQMKDTDGLLKVLTQALEPRSSKERTKPWGDSILILAATTLDGRKKFHQFSRTCLQTKGLHRATPAPYH